MSHRRNLNSLSPGERQTLVNLMMQYLTEPVIAAHTMIHHQGEHIFTGHRAYIAEMEAWLTSHGGGQFVPLPEWNPATTIPGEFVVVKQDAGNTRTPPQNLNPNSPKPAQFAPGAVCSQPDADTLGDGINGWHGGVHGAVGGTFGNFPEASAVPLFWNWHGYVDTIYDDWLACRWGGWTSLGGVISSAPAAASWASNRMDCFARGTDGAMWHKWWNGSSWSGWGSLGGLIQGAPAAVSWGPNRIDCFVRGMDNAMWHKFWNGASWSGWQSLGGSITSAPTVASWGPNRLDCFARGTDGALWRKWWNGSTWSGWQSLGGLIQGSPAAVSWGPDRIDCFVRGMDNAMWHKWWNGSAWIGWERLGGVLTAGPGAASWALNRLDCFAKGANDALWWKWVDRTVSHGHEGAWSGWHSIGGLIQNEPAAVSRQPNRIDCFVRGMDNAMWHKSFTL